MQQKQVFYSYELRTGQEKREYSFCPYCGHPLVFKTIDSKRQPGCLKCGFVHFANPLPTVSVIVSNGDSILLGQRLGEPGKGKWALPSGYIDFAEDFLTAAIREVKEETGLDVTIQSIVNVVSSFISPEYHFLGLYLLANITGGELHASDDLARVEWFPLIGPFPSLAFEEDRMVLEKYLQFGQDGIPTDPRFNNQRVA